MISRRIATLVLVVSLVGITFALPLPEKKAVAPGTWGGAHLRMEVSESGAELEFDCGSALISEPLALDANHNFHVAGSYKRGDFGPTREGEKTKSNAIFTGSVEGNTLKLTMELNDQDTTQSFTLTKGHEPKLFKCK